MERAGDRISKCPWSFPTVSWEPQHRPVGRWNIRRAKGRRRWRTQRFVTPTVCPSHSVTYCDLKTCRKSEWNDELRGVIDAALREEPRFRQVLICNGNGKPYTADGFQTNWQRLILRCLKEGRIAERFTFHDIRAKSESDAGSDQEAADRLGHGDAALTRRVYRRLPKRGRALRILDKPG